MDKNKSRYIKLGIFVVLGLLLFILATFYVGSQENLFTSTFTLKSVFKSVSGLREGNSVRFSGIDVGTVQEIEIIGTEQVLVELVIRNDVRKFIKKDSEVSIATEGLVGNKIVVISAGTETVLSVENDDMLKSTEPVDIGEILENLNKSTKDAQKISEQISEIVSKVNEGQGTLGQLINNDTLYRNIDSLMMSYTHSTQRIDLVLQKISGTVDIVSSGIGTFITEVENITKDIGDITSKINSSQSLVGTLLTDTTFANNLKEVIQNANMTTENLERGSYGFYQNMEALKHNFLFKGYFEDIGYWDKSEYEKAIEKKQDELRKKQKELDNLEKRLREIEKKIDEADSIRAGKN